MRDFCASLLCVRTMLASMLVGFEFCRITSYFLYLVFDASASKMFVKIFNKALIGCKINKAAPRRNQSCFARWQKKYVQRQSAD